MSSLTFSSFSSSIQSNTAFELLNTLHDSNIVTFCKDIDHLFDPAGIPLQRVTEFAGVPGVGKTQLCIQLACDVTIPRCFGGLDGDCIYIDTEGSFMAQRVEQVATSLVRHIRQVSRLKVRKRQKASKESYYNVDTKTTLEKVAASYDTASILSRIHLFRAFDHQELISIIQSLDTFMISHPKVRLIIIDSVSFHFRRVFKDFSLRARLLASIAQDLHRLAYNRPAAVVLTNQLTTRFKDDPVTGKRDTIMLPSLGESWAHACSNRILLQFAEQDYQRIARIVKSNTRPCNCVARFEIKSCGIRGPKKKS